MVYNFFSVGTLVHVCDINGFQIVQKYNTTKKKVVNFFEALTKNECMHNIRPEDNSGSSKFQDKRKN